MHYNKVYREVYPPLKCASCQAFPCIGCNNLPAQGSLAENDAIEEDEDQDTTSDIASESGCETDSDIETEIVTDFSHFMIHVDDDN